MSEIDESTKQQFIEGLSKMTEGAYEVMMAWDEEKMNDLLNNNTDLLAAYKPVFTMSFDEWWHELHNFVEKAQKVVRFELVDGDCVNCIHGYANFHHNKSHHPQINDDIGRLFPCAIPGCSCRSYTTLAMSEM